jgi:hypothetical protein
MPLPLFFSIIFWGLLAIKSYGEMNKSKIVVFVVTGVLLIVICNFFYPIFRKVYIQPDVTVTAVVLDGKWERNHNLGFGIVVTKTICVYPQDYWKYPLLLDVYEGTKVYERNGTSIQKIHPSGIEELQPGQIVEIKFKDLLIDSELKDILYARYDPRTIDTTYLIGAIEITIRKGETAPVDSNVSNGVCEILPEQ